jgi:hypothetical protein
MGDILGKGLKWMGLAGEGGLFGKGPGQVKFDPEIYDPRKDKTGPSPAELQLQTGLGRILAGQKAMAASSRGVNPALALRLAGRRGAEASATANDQAALLRAQEEEAYQRLMAQQWLARNAIMSQQAQFNANAEAAPGMIGSLLGGAAQAMGGAAGSYFGGPVGGAVGSQIGGGGRGYVSGGNTGFNLGEINSGQYD